MHTQEQQFFNALAQSWDETRSMNAAKLSRLIGMAGIAPGETVLDIGTGTGVLIPFLKEAVGDAGGITALDFAEAMVARAAQKHAHLSGIRYVAADIMKFQSEQRYNKIICLNFFPHVKDKPAFLMRVQELLAAGGSLIIMHDLSRAAINAIHSTSEVVKEDRLPPSAVVGQMLTEAGFEDVAAMDNDELYFVKGSIGNGHK